MENGVRYINLKDDFDGGEFLFQNDELVRITADPRDFPLDFAPVQNIKEEDWIRSDLYEKVLHHKTYIDFKHTVRGLNIKKIGERTGTWELENTTQYLLDLQNKK